MIGLLRRAGTPLGGCVMLLVCWLPWANVSCGDVRARPNLWQLADYRPVLYVYAALAMLIVVVGVVYMIHRHRSLAIACVVLALIAAGSWIYFLMRRDALIEQQMALQGWGGELGQWMRDVRINPGDGFNLYPVGVLIALTSSVWSALKGGSQNGIRGFRG